MAHIFIAYHHSDVELAYQIAEKLQEQGLAVWINPDPETGSAWYDWIEERLRQAAGMVVLASPESRASEHVTYEWASAVGSDIGVVPVRVRGAELHSRLAAMNGIDFSDSQPWDALIRRVCEIVTVYLKDKLWIPFGASTEIRNAIQALKSFDEESRRAALRRLAANDSTSARQTLAGALRHPLFPSVRVMAAQLVGDLREERAIPALIDALRDDEDSVSRAAAEALALIGAPAVDPLLESLEEEHRMGRRAAILALSRIATPETVPGLLEGLKMTGWFAPRTSAVTLGKIGDPRAVPGLIVALRSDDESLQALAAEALDAIGTPDARAAADRWRSQHHK